MSIRINGIDRESQLHEYSSMEHGQYRVNANPKLYEIQRSSDFEFIIDGKDMENLVSITTNQPFEDAQEILRLAVIQAPVPHFSIQPIETRRINSTTKYAGQPSFQSGSMQVRDWIGVDSLGILMAWQHQAYDVNTDKVGILTDYKKNATLIEYSPDKQIVRQWRIYGCWISDISEEAFNHESSNARQISATIQYDRAVLQQFDQTR